MNKKIYENIEKTIKTIVDAKKRGWYEKYIQLAAIRASFQSRIPTGGKLGAVMTGLTQGRKLPEDKKFLTKDAEFLTNLYNSGAEEEYSAKLMMKVMYGDKFDRMVAKYID